MVLCQTCFFGGFWVGGIITNVSLAPLLNLHLQLDAVLLNLHFQLDATLLNLQLQLDAMLLLFDLQLNATLLNIRLQLDAMLLNVHLELDATLLDRHLELDATLLVFDFQLDASTCCAECLHVGLATKLRTYETQDISAATGKATVTYKKEKTPEQLVASNLETLQIDLWLRRNSIFLHFCL